MRFGIEEMAWNMISLDLEMEHFFLNFIARYGNGDDWFSLRKMKEKRGFSWRGQGRAFHTISIKN